MNILGEISIGLRYTRLDPLRNTTNDEIFMVTLEGHGMLTVCTYMHKNSSETTIPSIFNRFLKNLKKQIK